MLRDRIQDPDFSSSSVDKKDVKKNKNKFEYIHLPPKAKLFSQFEMFKRILSYYQLNILRKFIKQFEGILT